MGAKLRFEYDREGDILYINKCDPYPEQESEELGDDVGRAAQSKDGGCRERGSSLLLDPALAERLIRNTGDRRVQTHLE